MKLPWLFIQREEELLFLAWPVPARVLQGRLPRGVELDLFDGTPWLTLIPFRMAGLRARLMPPVPGLSRFLEMDLLTCVRVEGEAGIAFLRIEAETAVGAWMGRHVFSLPYRRSRLCLERDGETRTFTCDDESGAAFACDYRPVGDVFHAAPGTLAHFIVERTVMFTATHGGTLLRGLERRSPRAIRAAEFAIRRDTLTEEAGVPGPTADAFAWHCERSEIRTWPPLPLRCSPVEPDDRAAARVAGEGGRREHA